MPEYGTNDLVFWTVQRSKFGHHVIFKWDTEKVYELPLYAYCLPIPIFQKAVQFSSFVYVARKHKGLK